MINSAIGKSLTRETPEETFELLEEVSLNAYQWEYDKPTRRNYGNHSIDTIYALLVQMETSIYALLVQMEALDRRMNNLNACLYLRF